jgi:hypothetical protein
LYNDDDEFVQEGVEESFLYRMFSDVELFDQHLHERDRGGDYRFGDGIGESYKTGDT